MNYWIFRCNKDAFDIENYLKNFSNIYWAVKHPKHQEEMMVGDKVFIWRSKGKSNDPYGVIATGEINELPKDKAAVSRPEFLGAHLWKVDEVSSIKVGVRITSFRLTLDEGMIDSDYFLKDKELASMQLITARQGTNFKISQKQYEIITSLWSGESEDEELTEYGAYEGRTKLILHKVRERDPSLVKKAKEEFVRKNGSIYCEACGVSFRQLFGFDYIEVHHKKPLSQIQSGEITKLSDLALLCANCHRAVHRIDDVDPYKVLSNLMAKQRLES